MLNAMLTKLLEIPGLTIMYDQVMDYLSLKWNGSRKSEEFREAGKEIIKAIRKTNAKFILSDNTDWKMISPNDHGWAAFNWFPAAEVAGIKKLASVVSKDYFNRLAESSIEGMADVECMEIRNFGTPQEALKWLTQSKNHQPCK